MIRAITTGLNLCDCTDIPLQFVKLGFKEKSLILLTIIEKVNDIISKNQSLNRNLEFSCDRVDNKFRIYVFI